FTNGVVDMLAVVLKTSLRMGGLAKCPMSGWTARPTKRQAGQPDLRSVRLDSPTYEASGWTARPTRMPELLSRGHGLLGDVVIGIDVLDVVVLFEELFEPEHLLAVLDVEVDRGRRDIAGLGALGRDPGIFQCFAHGLEQLRIAGHLIEAVDQLHVVGPGLEGGFHQAILVDVLGIDDEESLELKQEA